jgi:hypothetical protein
MTSPNSPVEQAIERIKTIDWTQGNECSRQGSYIGLFLEYIRRAAFWFRALNLDIKGSGWPAFDIAVQIDPSLEDDSKDEELIKLLMLSDCRYYERYFCLCYIHWSMIQDRPEVTQFNLPAPYEPVIIMFERGCEFPRKEFNIYDFPSVGIPVNHPENYYNRPPSTDLDSAALDCEDIEFLESRPKYNAEARS